METSTKLSQYTTRSFFYVYLIHKIERILNNHSDKISLELLFYKLSQVHKSQRKCFFLKTMKNKNVAEKCIVFIAIVTFPLLFPAVDAF